MCSTTVSGIVPCSRVLLDWCGDPTAPVEQNTLHWTELPPANIFAHIEHAEQVGYAHLLHYQTDIQLYLSRLLVYM